MAFHDRKVWIGSVPSWVEESEIKGLASNYGELTEIYYKRDMLSSRGWAFLQYTTKEEAHNAIRALDGKYKFPGTDRPVGARLAHAKDNSFKNANYTSIEGLENSSNYLSGSSSAVSSARLAPLTTGFSPPAVSNVPLAFNYTRSLWEQYHTPDGIPYYFNTITYHTQWEKPVPPKELVQDALGNKVYGPAGSNLFIFHVPSEWTDMELLRHFALFGNILSARIKTDANGKNYGFGFVSYDNSASAIAAISAMNGFAVGTKNLKVQLKKGEEHYLPADMQMQN